MLFVLRDPVAEGDAAATEQGDHVVDGAHPRTVSLDESATRPSRGPTP